jgi:L-aminopeptidase/D-esterase-like protein
MTRMTRREFSGALIASAAGGRMASLKASPASVAPNPETQGSITDVPGIRVGHFTDSRRPTGCTAILFDKEAAAGVDYDGSAPGDELGVMLQPVSPVETIHGILLTGGSPMGLAAVAGAMQYLEERGVGFNWGGPNIHVPIVVGAVIADLELGDSRIRPGPEAAYKACAAASSNPVEEGCVGVGAGATVGKMLVGHPGVKSGLGTASLEVGDVVIGALVVANSVGDIIDWHTGKIIAGALRPDGKGFANTIETLKAGAKHENASRVEFRDPVFHSTTLIVVATNATFTKTELTKIAMMAATGGARTINPYHTYGDGDSTFALSTRKVKSDLGVSVVGALTAEVVSEAVLRCVKTATSVEGWQAIRDLKFDS